MLAALMLSATAAAVPSEAGPDRSRSFALRAGRVIIMARDGQREFAPGLVIVRDGRIESVGPDGPVPRGIPFIDEPDATVTPGLIAAACEHSPPHTGDESIAGAYRAVDAFDPYENFNAELAAGVTTVHLHGGLHRLVTGRGAVVKLGGPREGQILLAAADITMNFGEAAYDPPNDVTYTTPSSSDLPIPPGIRQRPDSRMGQYLAIEEALARGEPEEHAPYQLAAFVRAWREELPLRIHAHRGVDIDGALGMMGRHDRKGYIVGAADADLVADSLVRAEVPVVYRVRDPLRGGALDIGLDPEAIEADRAALARLSDVTLAIAVAEGSPPADLRLAAATALRAGLSRMRVLEAVTLAPAEILGVSERVGSLEPGKHADLVVWSGDPLTTGTHVLRAYIGGSLAFAAPKTDALVVRAGLIWVDEQTRIRDGAVLIERGKITAVGHAVPHPPFAKVIEAGEEAFVSPGFIDAYGHLGLDGDRAGTSADLSLVTIVGVPDVTDLRVARAGVTTVMLAPYDAASDGSQVAAIKTAGRDRTSRLVRAAAGVVFDMKSLDPMQVEEKLRKRLEAGKKYLEEWQKFEKELAEWKEKRAKGEKVETKPKETTVKESEIKEDPITGTWSVTLSGGPMPEPQTASMKLRLTGTDIEGYITVPGAPEEVRIVATLDGKRITGRIEIDTGGMGYPELEAELTEPDHMAGQVKLQGIEIDLDARRTDKAAVEFKVVKRNTRGKDGRPLPPKMNETLEALRTALEKKIPLVVSVESPAQIAAVLKVTKEFEIPLVLHNAEAAAAHADALVERAIGVVVPKTITRLVHDAWYHQADDLARRGIPVGFQSDAEDAARTLPLIGLYAVERGLSADAALAALTVYPSRMYKLEDRIGMLAPGRDGDLLIFNGHPFDAGSRLMRVIVNGREVRR